MEDLGNFSSGESPLEESDLLPLPTEQEQLSLAETPMVYKAHAAVGAVIFIEGFFTEIFKNNKKFGGGWVSNGNIYFNTFLQYI